MFFDNTYFIFVVPAIIISLIAQMMVKSAYSKYSKISSRTNLTGKDVAEMILRRNGIVDVRVIPTGGTLTDHFDPRNNTVALSQGVYNSSSIAAVAIASHEVGHVIQHERGYAPIKIRSALVPVANIGANFSWILFFIGFLIDATGLMNLGIILFSTAFLFQLVTLPVEFNASSRALAELSGGIVADSEIGGAKKVLSAAALTYVAAMLASLLQLMRLVVLRDRRD